MHPYKVLEGNEHAKAAGEPPLGMTSYGVKIDGTDFGSFLFEEPEVFVIFAVNFVRAINGGMPVPRKASILRGCPIINQHFGDPLHLWKAPNLPCIPAFERRLHRARNASPSSKPTKRGCAVNGRSSTTRAPANCPLVAELFREILRFIVMIISQNRITLLLFIVIVIIHNL
jgi:hypothetical protein